MIKMLICWVKIKISSRFFLMASLKLDLMILAFGIRRVPAPSSESDHRLVEA